MPSDCAHISALRPDGSVDAGAISRLLAVRVYRHLSSLPTNFVFSPLAFELTLAKLMRTLRPDAARRIAHNLCLEQPPPPAFEQAIEAQLAAWRALHTRKGEPGVHLEYRARTFRAPSAMVPDVFEETVADPARPDGVTRIARWMAPISQGARLPPLAGRAALVTALSFKGDWAAVLDMEQARIDFARCHGKRAKVSAYSGIDMRGATKDACDHLAIVKQHYQKSDLSLYAALPRRLRHFDDALQYWHLDAALHLVDDRVRTIAIVPEFRLRSVLSVRCCGLEWLQGEVGDLIQSTSLDTPNHSRRLNHVGFDTIPSLAAPRPMPPPEAAVALVASADFVLLMGRLAYPR